MEKRNTITIRLSDEQYGWLRALSRRSKRSQSEVVRSLIEQGTVRERITRENLDIIRKLIGEKHQPKPVGKASKPTRIFPSEGRVPSNSIEDFTTDKTNKR